MVEGEGDDSDLMNPVLLTAAGNPENQDRGIILVDDLRAVLCVADGAGGRSGGMEAAAMAMEFIRHGVTSLHSAESCVALLRAMDEAVSKDAMAGETTCVLVVVTGETVFGASVGDSGAWIIPEAGAHLDLTRGQQRKPFVGTSIANPVSFNYPKPEALLLLATDGLLKYAAAECIISVCREQMLESAPQRLVGLVRYPSGSLPDDVTVILAKV